MEIQTLQGKFYQYEVSFNGFADIDEDYINYLKEQYNTERQNTGSRLALYIDTLKHLNGLRVRQTTYKTFDERIFTLILMIDPNFVMYHTYNNAAIPTQAQINNASLEQKQELLEQKRNETNKLIRTIREKIGVYDSKMLKYEAILYKKFLKPERIISEAGKDFTQDIMRAAKVVRSFDNISFERYKEINDLVTYWGSETNALGNAKLASYTLTQQNNILKLKTVKEQILFFIMAVDPELKMLTIYEEESRMPEVKRRILEEFGFDNEDMLRLERLYHDRFCPEKKISTWSI